MNFKHLHPTDTTSERRLYAILLVAFGLVVVVTGADIAWDLRAGTPQLHVVAEVLVVALGLAGAGTVSRQLVVTVRAARAAREEARERARLAQEEARAAHEEAATAHEHARTLAERLAATEAEAARWRTEARDHLNGLAAALDLQFERWALSPAEKEVALLLLKGLSHKELAEVRSITEATARQQARAVYKKSGLSGRADLAAFFLEDLLLPATGDRPPGARGTGDGTGAERRPAAR